jgi:hypothetical protein
MNVVTPRGARELGLPLLARHREELARAQRVDHHAKATVSREGVFKVELVPNPEAPEAARPFVALFPYGAIVLTWEGTRVPPVHTTLDRVDSYIGLGVSVGALEAVLEGSEYELRGIGPVVVEPKGGDSVREGSLDEAAERAAEAYARPFPRDDLASLRLAARAAVPREVSESELREAIAAGEAGGGDFDWKAFVGHLRRPPGADEPWCREANQALHPGQTLEMSHYEGAPNPGCVYLLHRMPEEYTLATGSTEAKAWADARLVLETELAWVEQAAPRVRDFRARRSPGTNSNDSG